MKSIRKHLPLLALTFLLAIAAVLAVPGAAEAAKSKSKSSTLAVTDTKISGFKEITNVVSFDEKTVIFFGTNSSGANIYTYSTNGKKFSGVKKLGLTDVSNYYNNGKYLVIFGKNSKGENAYIYSTNGKSFSGAKKLGLTGNLSYESGNSGKSLYVLATDSDTGKVTYKYVTNPTKLASAKVVSIEKKISVPSGMKVSSRSISTYGQMYGSKLYLTASYSFREKDGYSYDYESNNYILILNKNKVSVTNITAAIEKKLSGKKVSSVSVNVCYSAKSYKAVITANLYSSSNYSTDYAYFVTKNGTSFSKIADVPEKNGYSSSIQWIGTKLYAFNRSSYDTGMTLESSGNKAVYYVYKGGSWKKVKTSMKSSKGYVMSSVRSNDSYYYAYCSGFDSVLQLVENNTKVCRISYTKNGTSWKTLPGIKLSYTSKGTCSNVSVTKTDTGTFAEVAYKVSDSKSFVAIYQLKSGKWKELKALAVKSIKVEGENYSRTYFSASFYGGVPSAIYYDGSKTRGYNLKTGKSYVLPFQYVNYSLIGGDTKVYYYKNKLYGTTNTYKTVTTIALKAGKKTIKSEIKAIYYGSTKKGSFEYLQCGKKIYAVTYDAIIKAVK